MNTRSFQLALLLFAALPGLASAADPTALLFEARAARDAKDVERAVELGTALIADRPASAEPYIERGFTYLYSGRPDYRALAAADFKKAAEVDPLNVRAILYRGDLAHRLIEKNYAACEADYATVLKLDPAYPIRAYTAELYLYMKDPARVVAEAALGLAADPTAPIHRINLAHGLAFSGQVEAAKTIYTAIAPLDIAHGRTGAAFALGDFATLAKHGVNYPQVAELTAFFESLRKTQAAH
jgi:tetratricopeptide (TPR) repeat protein